MPTISVNQDLIAKLLSIHGLEHGIKQISDQLPLLGTDIDRCDEDILDIEIFPNRPDLLSGETLSLAIRNFIHHQNTGPELEVSSGNITMTVDKELKQIRPVILGAVVRNIDLERLGIESDEFIKSLSLIHI